MWNPVYEKCGKVVGITVQIMLYTFKMWEDTAKSIARLWVLLELILCQNPGNFVLLLLEKDKNLMQIYLKLKNENKTISIWKKHQMDGNIVWTI